VNFREFNYLKKGSRVVWKKTGEHGKVVLREGNRAYVMWDHNGDVERLVREDDADAMMLEPLEKSAKIARIEREREALSSLTRTVYDVGDPPPTEQARILRDIAELRARKKEARGAVVLMECEKYDDDE
jgi:hypothetical protein